MRKKKKKKATDHHAVFSRSKSELSQIYQKWVDGHLQDKGLNLRA